MLTLMLFSASCCSKPEWLFFFCGTQEICFNIFFCPSQNISFFVFHRRKVWNDMKVTSFSFKAFIIASMPRCNAGSGICSSDVSSVPQSSWPNTACELKERFCLSCTLLLLLFPLFPTNIPCFTLPCFLGDTEVSFFLFLTFTLCFEDVMTPGHPPTAAVGVRSRASWERNTNWQEFLAQTQCC